MKYLGIQTNTLPLGTPDDFALDVAPLAGSANGKHLVARFVCPEFTSLCPVTGQPDFAHIVIDYIPDLLIVESKSLKIYLTTFRNFGHFHEACSRDIFDKIVNTAHPVWARVSAFWYPRGGIPIDVVIQTGQPPQDAHVLDVGVSPFRGRG